MSGKPAQPMRARLGSLEAVICDGTLKPTARVIYAAICLRYVNGDELRRSGAMEAWPSVARLALELKLSAETISAGIAQLRRAGYLELVTARQGRGLTNRYRLIPHTAPPLAENPWKPGGFLGVKTPGELVAFEVCASDKTSKISGSERVENVDLNTPKTSPPNPLTETFDLNPSRDPRAN